MKVEELGHLVLYVRDVERSAAFYRDLLGWKPIFVGAPGVPVAAFSSGRTHHELLLIEVGESDDELRDALRRVHDAGVTVVGMSDHTVTHSLYVLDPDGNEVELYIDVPGVDWRNDPSLILAPIKPLSL